MNAHRARRSSVAVLATSLLALTGRAGAEPSSGPRAGVHLSWVRAAGALGCADAGSVQADVVRRLGYDPFGEPSQTSIEVAVDRTEPAWRAQIESRTPSGGPLGSRTVTSEAVSCTSLAAAAGLAIALMIDPEALTRPHDPVQASPPPTPPKVVTPPPVMQPPVARHSLGTAVAGPVVAFGVLPSVALGVQLGGERAVGERMYVRLSGVFLPEQRHSAAGGRLGFGMSWAALGLARHFPLSSEFALVASASVLMGALHSVVMDPIPLRPGERFWWATAAGVELQWWPLTSLGVQLDGEVLAPLNRHRYLIDQAGSAASSTLAFEEPIVGAVLRAALQLAF